MAEVRHPTLAGAASESVMFSGLGGRASPRVGVLDAVGLRLLDSVIDITAEHDHARFRASFRGTLQELLEVGDVAFIRPTRGAAGQVTFELVHEDEHLEWQGARPAPAPRPGLRAEHLDEMMAKGQALVFEQGRVTLLLPVMHHETLIEIVAVSGATLPPESFYLVRAFARLYCNFLALIMATERDALTGLLNRRTLETRLAALSVEAARLHSPRARIAGERRDDGDDPTHFVAMLDVDRFKSVNDRFGHLFGDEVLLLVSRLMRDVLRDEDLLFRYGGEEFCAVLVCQTREAAVAALERFRQRVSEHRFPQLDRLTISVGLAQMRRSELAASAISRADQALYCAKEGGRNRVCDYDKELAAGRLHTEPDSNNVELF